MVKQVTSTIKRVPKKTKAVITKKAKKAPVSKKPKSSFAGLLARVIDQIPTEWHGTTFKNKVLFGREEWSKKFLALLTKKGNKVTSKDLTNLGNAEDYMRVSTNISTMYETVLANKYGFESVNSVFTFSSSKFPWMSLMLTNDKVIHCHGDQPFTAGDVKFLALIKCYIKMHPAGAKKQQGINISTNMADCGNSEWDAVISNGVLYINNTSVIIPADIMVVRKRMCTPMTSAACLAAMQKEAGVKATYNTKKATAAQEHTFYTHLQELSGTRQDKNSYPVCCTAGLPAICAFWFALIKKGGADILMASTAYGGSCQLTDLFNERTNLISKHKFDITGTRNLESSIKESMDALAKTKSSLPTTVLFVEIPSNPDMKVPDIKILADMCQDFKNKTKKEVVLLVDTTFAPASKCMEQIKSQAADLTTLNFISMSKSVSRGMTCAGTIIAGPSNSSRKWLEEMRKIAVMMDTQVRKDQMLHLCQNHHKVHQRCLAAYENSKASSDLLVATVKAVTKQDMHIHGVTPANAAIGFTSSTYSFNLPPKGKSLKVNEALSQNFVDMLCENKHFKPCVSFGQDNNLIYCTVPATSTQGAISAADKDKQEVGGVQLARLSFPPTMQRAVVFKHIQKCVKEVYQK